MTNQIRYPDWFIRIAQQDALLIEQRREIEALRKVCKEQDNLLKNDCVREVARLRTEIEALKQGT